MFNFRILFIVKDEIYEKFLKDLSMRFVLEFARYYHLKNVIYEVRKESELETFLCGQKFDRIYIDKDVNFPRNYLRTYTRFFNEDLIEMEIEEG